MVTSDHDGMVVSLYSMSSPTYISRPFVVLHDFPLQLHGRDVVSAAHEIQTHTHERAPNKAHTHRHRHSKKEDESTMYLSSSASVSGRRTLQWSHRLLHNNYNYKYNYKYNNNSSSNDNNSSTPISTSKLGNASALQYSTSGLRSGGLGAPIATTNTSSSSPSSSLLLLQQQQQQMRQFHSNIVALRNKPRKHVFKLARWLRRTGTRRYKKAARSLSKQNRNSLLYQLLREEDIAMQDLASEIEPHRRPDIMPMLRQIAGVSVGPRRDPTMVTPDDDFPTDLSDMNALARLKRELDGKMGKRSDREKKETVAGEEGEEAETAGRGHRKGEYVELNAEGELPVVDIPLEENKLWTYLQDELKRDDIESMDENKLFQRFSFDEYIGVLKHRQSSLEEMMVKEGLSEKEVKDLAVTARLVKEKMRMAFTRRLRPIDADSAPMDDNTFVQWVKSTKDMDIRELDAIPYDELIRSFKMSDVADSIRYLTDDDAYDLFHMLKPVLAEASYELTVLPDTLPEESPDEELLDLLDHVKAGMEKDGEEWNDLASKSFYFILQKFRDVNIDVMGSKEKLAKLIEQAKTSHPTSPMREKMWQLHLENPHYWTGERLARAFGIDRDEAWMLLITREAREAKERGLPFNSHKIRVIFRKNIRDEQNEKYFENNPARLKKKRRMIRTDKVPYGMTMNEEDAYKYFLEETEKALPSGGGDDLLPDWAKLPFQKPNITEDKIDEPLKVLPTIPSETNLGSDLPRAPISFIEASPKDIPPSERLLMVKEIDGTLREMSMLEKEIAFRKGSVKKTKMGLGGKARRRRAMRQRRF